MTCVVCEGIGEIEVRSVNSSAWVLIDCPWCAALGMTVLPVPVGVPS